MSAEQPEFQPDWTLAPSELLREWMSENGVDRAALIARCDPGAFEEHAEAVVDSVLARKPLTKLMAATLARGTGIPARYWLNYEANYRADLAAGRTDVSSDD